MFCEVIKPFIVGSECDICITCPLGPSPTWPQNDDIFKTSIEFTKRGEEQQVSAYFRVITFAGTI